MRRYRFPLTGVLRVRTSARDQAAIAAADAARAAAAARARLDEAKAGYARTVPNGGVHSTQQLLSQRLIQELGADRIREAADRTEVAEAELLGRRAALAAASSAVKALEELEARQRAEHRAAAQKLEAKRIDDLVVSRHGRPDA